MTYPLLESKVGEVSPWWIEGRYEGHSKSSKTNSKKKNSEYGNQIRWLYLHDSIWLPYSEVFFLEFVLELFECPSYSVTLSSAGHLIVIHKAKGWSRL